MTRIRVDAIPVQAVLKGDYTRSTHAFDADARGTLDLGRWGLLHVLIWQDGHASPLGRWGLLHVLIWQDGHANPLGVIATPSSQYFAAIDEAKAGVGRSPDRP